MRLGVDVSNYTEKLDLQALACLRAQGYDFVIPGDQVGKNGNFTPGQIAAARDAGFEVPAVYSFLYWDGRDSERVAFALSFGLPVWLDCEWNTGGRPPSDILGIIGALVAQCGDKVAGLYTGQWWWPGATGNSNRFSHLPLWHAAYIRQGGGYPGSVPTRIEGFQSYGGWTKPTIWQFASEGPCGITADHNLWDAPVVPQEDNMIRFNAVANPAFWPGHQINGDQGMAARSDFGLPETAKTIRLEVYLNSGLLQVLDGQTLAVAGEVGWGASGPSYQQLDVNIPDGVLVLRGQAVVAQLGIVGYWV